VSIPQAPKGIVSPSDSDDLLLTPTAEGDWIAAVHEAGHAVLATIVGYELKDRPDYAAICSAAVLRGNRDTESA
jgi:hypothetical protein